MEEVRLLANIESDTDKLLPVVLVGQPELADRLNEPALRQLKQRVALRCQLDPLELHQTAAYIAHRLTLAGGDPASVFSREAVIAIHERSHGIPRSINVVCDNALLTGFALERRPIESDVIAEVGDDFDLTPAMSGRDDHTGTLARTFPPGVDEREEDELADETRGGGLTTTTPLAGTGAENAVNREGLRRREPRSFRRTAPTWTRAKCSISTRVSGCRRSAPRDAATG